MALRPPFLIRRSTNAPAKELVEENAGGPPVALLAVDAVAVLRLEHLGRDVVGRANGGARALHQPLRVHLDARAKVGELEVGGKGGGRRNEKGRRVGKGVERGGRSVWRTTRNKAHLEVPARVQKQIVGLDVTVDVAKLVQRVQGHDQLCSVEPGMGKQQDQPMHTGAEQGTCCPRCRRGRTWPSPL